MSPKSTHTPRAAPNGEWRLKVRLWGRAAALALLCLLAGPPASAQPETPITFSVKKSSLLMSASNPLAAGKGPDEVIGVTLQGVLYDPPLLIGPAAKEAIERARIESALASDRGANLAGDADWMVSGFVAGERGQLRAFFEGKPSRMERNQAAAKSIERFLLEGWVKHGKYRLVLIIQERAGRVSRLVYTFVSSPEGWLRTNALSAEPVFDVVFSAAIGGKIAPGGR